jgi:hypothetical protein
MMFVKLIPKARIKALDPERAVFAEQVQQVIRLRHWPINDEECLVSFEEKREKAGWHIVSAASIRSERHVESVRQHIAAAEQGRICADADKELIPPGKVGATIRTFESTITGT